MNIEINPALEFEALRHQFKKHKKLRIDNFLTSESADHIAENLEAFTDWHLVHSDEGGLPVRYDASELSKLSALQHTEINSKLNRRAAERYQYKYKFYPIIDAVKTGSLSSSTTLFTVANFVNSTDFIGFSRALTGINSLVKMDPQASLYESGDFLTMHDDSNYQRGANDQSTRRVAVVFGFTRKWGLDWGGQTSFYSHHEANEALSWVPGFNVLSLFEVPVLHSVNYVTPFATHGRYSITGWLRDDPTIRRPDLGD